MEEHSFVWNFPTAKTSVQESSRKRFQKSIPRQNKSFNRILNEGVQASSYGTTRFGGPSYNTKLQIFFDFLLNIRISVKRSQWKILSKKFLLQVWCVNWEFDERSLDVFFWRNSLSIDKNQIWWHFWNFRTIGIMMERSKSLHGTLQTTPLQH